MAPGQVRDCLLFAELSGVTPEQFAAADAVWSAIDPDRFASQRAARTSGTGSNSATIQQALAELEVAIEGIAWGADDGPALHGLSGSCEPAE